MNITNSHTHTFTLDHVPNRVFSWLPLSWARKHGLIKWIITNVPRIFKSRNDFLDRYASLLALMDLKSQEQVFEKLKSFYPKDTKFVVLSMDMEHMSAGKPKITFQQQLNELADLKKKYPNTIFPFICADPRNPNVTEMVKDYITKHHFQGIKLYPALGFYQFDIRLHEVYKFAIKNNIPIISHCCKGVIYDRGEIKDENRIHPITGKPLNESKKREFTTHFTDPKNFHYLMDKTILQKYMDKYHNGTEAPDFSKLKICFAHFGGNDEWDNYLRTPWNPAIEENTENTNWYSDIRDLIDKYENVYSDISFMIADESCYPLLKVMIEDGIIATKQNLPDKENQKKQKLAERILFGTDFFLVEQKSTERDLTIKLRAYLGYENFKQIAEINPQRFL